MSISRETFDPSKQYKRLRFHQRRDLLDSELNELQESARYEQRQLFDVLAPQGAIAQGVTPTVAGAQVTVNAGHIYCDGVLVPVADTVLDYDPAKNTGVDYVWLEVLRLTIDAAQDATLVNPATGEPTAEREQWLATLTAANTADDPLPPQATGRTTVALYAFDRATGAITPTVSAMLSAQDKVRLDAHLNAGGAVHPVATGALAGFMSPADKAKLDTVASGATVARRAATLTIAAANAMPASRQMADVVCSGVADEVAINTALATLTAGGLVMLTEGTFSLTGAIIVPSSVVLAGQGEATVLRLTDAVATGCSLVTNQQAETGKDYGIVIRDLTLDGNRAAQSPTGWKDGIRLKNVYRSAVERCFVKQIYGEGIFLESGAFNRIEGCHVEHCTLTGITLQWSDFTQVWNNRAYRNEEYGIENQSSSGGQLRGNLVAGNRFEGLYAIGVDLDVCNNRAFLNGQVGGADHYNIYVSGRGLVAFNIIRDDFTETGGIGEGWFNLVQAYEGVNAGTTQTTSKGLYVGGGAFCVANDLYAGGVNADLTLDSDEWNPTVQQTNRTTSTARTNPGTWD